MQIDDIQAEESSSDDDCFNSNFDFGNPTPKVMT